MHVKTSNTLKTTSSRRLTKPSKASDRNLGGSKLIMTPSKIKLEPQTEMKRT